MVLKLARIILVVGGLSWLSACAPIKVEGSLDVTHTANLQPIYGFFLEYCNGDEACADQRMNDFLTWLYTTGDN